MGARRSATIVAGAIAAVAVTAAAMVGVRQLNASQGAAVTPTPPTTSAASTTPAPSPSLTQPSGPPVREAVIDDATVEARILVPRTGETWTTPVHAPEMASVLAPDDGWTPYLVGHRGSTRIYVVTDMFMGTAMIAEVDASGARQISCPSARSTDACVPSAGVPGVALDTSTFYDSLTLPASIDLGAGWVLGTSSSRKATYYGSASFMINEVDPSSRLDGSGYFSVDRVGGLRVVESKQLATTDGTGSNLDLRSYVLVAPIGLTYEVDPQSLPGADYESIRWDDGVTRTEGAAFGASSLGGGSLGCMLGQFSVPPDLDQSQWSRAGQTREGAPVYVPTEANPLVHTIRAVQVDMADMARQNGGYPRLGENRAYPFASDAAFRDAHALYAIAGPDGGGRSDCAVTPWSSRTRVATDVWADSPPSIEPR